MLIITLSGQKTMESSNKLDVNGEMLDVFMVLFIFQNTPEVITLL